MKRMLVCMLVGLALAAMPAAAATITVDAGGGGDYTTIQMAINNAADGDIIQVADGVYYESLNIYKPLSIFGASETNTVIDASGFSDYAIDARSDLAVAFAFADFTLIGHPSYTAAFGLKVAGDDVTVSVERVTVQGCFRTGLDFNGLAGGTVTNCTVTGTVNGVGLGMANCSNITISGLTTSGNGWAGMAVYADGTYYTGGSDNVVLTGTNSFAEPVALYTEEADGFFVTNFQVSTADFGALMGNNLNPAAVAYVSTVAAAQMGVLATDPVNGWVIDRTDGSFAVAAGMSIQAAINAAADGDDINVADGAYAENVVLNKAVTLLGANADAVCDARGAESVISPASGLPVSITADGATLNGFAVTTAAYNYGIILSGTSDVSVVSNNVHDINASATPIIANTYGIYYMVPNAPAAPGNVTIADNCVANIASSSLTGNSAGAIAVLQSTSTGTLTNLTISGNTITGVNVNTGSWPTGKIAYGIILNTGSGSYLTTTGKLVDAVVADNVIDGLSGFISTGIGLEGNTENASVTGNSVANLYGAKLSDRAGGGYDLNGLKFESNRYVGTVTVAGNSFDRSTFNHAGTPGLGYAVANYVPVGDAYAGGVTAAADVTCNWFGTADADAIADAVDLTGAILNKVGAESGFIPFLTTGDLGTAECIGGQPVHNITQGTHHVTIQEAIDAALGGDEIVVDAGTYAENLVFNKSLTVLGPNAYLSPNTDTRVAEAVLMPAGGDAINGVAADIDVVFKGMLVDMAGSPDRTVEQTGRAGTSWLFENNIFRNASGATNGDWYLSANTGLLFSLLDNLFTGNDVSNGIAVWSTNPVIVDIRDNVWENNEYTAMNLNHAQGVISGNIFRDTRTIDFADPNYDWFYFQSGILLAGDNYDLVISDNQFENVQYGVSMYANVDGPITIENNTFNNVYVSAVRASSSQYAAGTDLADVTVSGNSFTNYHGTGTMVANARPDMAPLNASNNWWDSASGPYHPTLNPQGQGVPVSDYVVFEPWVGMGGFAATPATAGPINCGETQTVTVGYTPDAYTPAIRGYSVTLSASAELSFTEADITNLGPFAGLSPLIIYETTDNGDGTVTVDCAIAGPTAGLTAAADLFSVVLHPAADGDGTLSLLNVVLRDLDNNDIGAAALGATVSVDCTAPPAAANLAAAPGGNEVRLSWTMADASDVDHFELWRAVWHTGDNTTSAYPEYDDVNPATPVRAADRAGLVASDEWTLVNAAVAGTATSYNDQGAARGVYWYELVAVDAAGNAGPLPAANDRATNYFLGDFNLDGQVVGTGDVTALGAAYGTMDGVGDVDYNNAVDIGPTDDNSGLGIPTTDSEVGFEDLMIFALNYDSVAKAAGEIAVDKTINLAWVDLGDGTWSLQLVDACAGALAIRVNAALADDATVRFERGELLDSQQVPAFLANDARHGLDLGVAALGAPFTGTGELLRVTVTGATDVSPRIDVFGVDGSVIEVALKASSVDIPGVLALRQNFPNPFNPSTTIAFDLPAASQVKIVVYGIDGRVVRTLVNETMPAGRHGVLWNGLDDGGRRAASGMYFSRLYVGGEVLTRKMTMLK